MTSSYMNENKASELIQAARKQAIDLLNNKLPVEFVYHNINHTERVVESVEEIIAHSTLTNEQINIVLIAAWFHDVGYIDGCDNHESSSQKYATAFLKSQNVDQELINQVNKCIDATRIKHEPETLPQKVIRDADASHLAADDFESTSELLRQEWKLMHIKDYSPEDWIDVNIQMLANKHRFYTSYARQHWQSKKQENLSDLLQKKKKQEKKLDKEKQKAKFKADFKNDNPERSIQTLFRVTLRNHINLSEIADTKANILLSVNAIIISLALSNIIPKLDNPSNQHLMIPSLILVVFSVVSIIMSIMSTRPQMTSGKFTKEQVRKREVNILFFGNFHKMNFENYKWGIEQIMDDKDYVYESLTRDLYSLGVVLARKYKLLRLTYTVFVVGIIISVISFLVAFSNMS